MISIDNVYMNKNLLKVLLCFAFVNHVMAPVTAEKPVVAESTEGNLTPAQKRAARKAAQAARKASMAEQNNTTPAVNAEAVIDASEKIVNEADIKAAPGTSEQKSVDAALLTLRNVRKKLKKQRLELVEMKKKLVSVEALKKFYAEEAINGVRTIRDLQAQLDKLNKDMGNVKKEGDRGWESANSFAVGARMQEETLKAQIAIEQEKVNKANQEKAALGGQLQDVNDANTKNIIKNKMIVAATQEYNARRRNEPLGPVQVRAQTKAKNMAVAELNLLLVPADQVEATANQLTNEVMNQLSYRQVQQL